MSVVRIGIPALNRVCCSVLRCARTPAVPGRLCQPGLQTPIFAYNVHTSCTLDANLKPTQLKKWPRYNDIVYPPRGPDEPRRPAEVFHSRTNIKYSPKKMWYIASMIRGMSIDEALKQLSFVQQTGGAVAKEVLLEAQEMAVRDNNVEYKSNLWIADSFVGKSYIIKGLRKHAGLRFGTVHYRYCHYFVVLREGPLPKHYYEPEPTGHQRMKEYLDKLRSRTIRNSL